MSPLEFFLQNKEVLNLKITRFAWPDDFDLPIYDYGLEFSRGGVLYEGRGIHNNKYIAQVKAASEALERFLVDHYGLNTSNGCALHTNEESAERLALFELVERDSFLCHYLTKKPFFRSFDLDTSLKYSTRLNNWLNSLGIFLYLQQMKTIHPHLNGVVCIAVGANHAPKFGVCIGLAVSSSIHEACSKAFLECCFRLVPLSSQLKSNETIPLTPKEFERLTKPKARDHMLLGLHPESAIVMRPLFSDIKNHNNNPSQDLGYNGLDIDVEVKHFNERPEFLDNCDYKFVQVKSNGLQNLYHGSPQPEGINFTRLSRFAEKEIFISNINYFNHCLG